MGKKHKKENQIQHRKQDSLIVLALVACAIRRHYVTCPYCGAHLQGHDEIHAIEHKVTCILFIVDSMSTSTMNEFNAEYKGLPTEFDNSVVKKEKA